LRVGSPFWLSNTGEQSPFLFWPLECFHPCITTKGFWVKIVLAGFSVAAFAMAQTAKDDIKGAGRDVKEAGKATGSAAKKTGRATKKTVKKGVNKAAQKTDEGADKVEQKTR